MRPASLTPGSARLSIGTSALRRDALSGSITPKISHGIPAKKFGVSATCRALRRLRTNGYGAARLNGGFRKALMGSPSTSSRQAGARAFQRAGFPAKILGSITSCSARRSPMKVFLPARTGFPLGLQAQGGSAWLSSTLRSIEEASPSASTWIQGGSSSASREAGLRVPRPIRITW